MSSQNFCSKISFYVAEFPSRLFSPSDYRKNYPSQYDCIFYFSFKVYLEIRMHNRKSFQDTI